MAGAQGELCGHKECSRHGKQGSSTGTSSPRSGTKLPSIYEGPSTIYVPDAHLAELLRERRTSWNMTATPAGQLHRRILKAITPRLTFQLADPRHRATSDPDWQPGEMAMWLAYQTASLPNLEGKII